MTNSNPILPLFKLSDSPDSMSDGIIEFTKDDYNKDLSASLINAQTDGQAVVAFLREYKDSPETLRSYAKEIERLLLWCGHVAKINCQPPSYMLQGSANLYDPLGG